MDFITPPPEEEKNSVFQASFSEMVSLVSEEFLREQHQDHCYFHESCVVSSTIRVVLNWVSLRSHLDGSSS